jgi:hypothetical protein
MARTYSTALGTVSAEKIKGGYIITANSTKIGEVFNASENAVKCKFEYKPENTSLGSAYAGTLKEAVEAIAYSVKKYQEAQAAAAHEREANEPAARIAAADKKAKAALSEMAAYEHPNNDAEWVLMEMDKLDIHRAIVTPTAYAADAAEDAADRIARICRDAILRSVEARDLEARHHADAAEEANVEYIRWQAEITAESEEEATEATEENKPQTLLSDAFVVAATGDTIAAKAGYTICYDSVTGLYKLTANACTTLIERAGDLYRWCWVRPADAAPALRACEPQQELTVSVVTGNPKAVDGYRATRSRLEIKAEVEEWGGVFIRTTVVRGNDYPDSFDCNALFYTDTAVTVQTWRSINEVEISPAWYPILAAQGTPKITNPDATGNEVAAFWVAQIESFCQMWQRLGDLLYAAWARLYQPATAR